MVYMVYYIRYAWYGIKDQYATHDSQTMYHQSDEHMNRQYYTYIYMYVISVHLLPADSFEDFHTSMVYDAHAPYTCARTRILLQYHVFRTVFERSCVRVRAFRTRIGPPALHAQALLANDVVLVEVGASCHPLLYRIQTFGVLQS